MCQNPLKPHRIIWDIPKNIWNLTVVSGTAPKPPWNLSKNLWSPIYYIHGIPSRIPGTPLTTSSTQVPQWNL